MTDAAISPGAPAARPASSARDALLKKRHRSEKLFRAQGIAAIVIAMIFLVVLVGRIVVQGYSTFETHTLTVPVYLNPERIDTSALEGVNYDYIVAEAMMKKLGVQDDDLGTVSSKVQDLVSRDFGNQLLQMVKKDHSLIGKTVDVTGSVKADADLYYKGEIKRSTAEGDRKLDNQQLDWLDRLKKDGTVKTGFNTKFFTNSDSTEPEQAGVWGAVIGSAMMLVITALIAIPVGVMAAVYLEEFAPKNRWTDVIEVNINNLAAVPSIVYGLLGLALFINWLHVPRGSPLVGGLVLALMALPTVIIATRSALKAVPPSIREAALGVGASKAQTVFHHVLPLAMPGVMTGAILSLAHALGETAPLLMIGMVAFVPGAPESFTSSATVLPVQVFIWENASERAFHERTAAAIIVLLVFMIVMNAAAVILRRRFERRW
ncbi:MULTISPECIES: phosphate ABC transporter permease PstA [Caulobacter]|jgi:phosphate transport system permease protein|uniref:Phosphate transport system permease protein PstA n=1 Tax=Caulobacter rhizosphaerae TaxID=2010972 RepID=A0ABU1MWE0_9CAUL|nr:MULTISPECIES: phosphate ABC transporter permease PstA [Caulobacter]KQZ30699.1 phosphate ABC transporter permease [Caulobacter sp. Root1472]MDR6530502.1 phosphate transport system permease protein [Caulobacter rhizosphaerae]